MDHGKATARPGDESRRTAAVGPRTSSRFGSCEIFVAEHSALKDFDCSFSLVRNANGERTIRSNSVHAARAEDRLSNSYNSVPLLVVLTTCSLCSLWCSCCILLGCPYGRLKSADEEEIKSCDVAVPPIKCTVTEQCLQV